VTLLRIDCAFSTVNGVASLRTASGGSASKLAIRELIVFLVVFNEGCVR
jgi:hypothetical protein